MDGKYIINNSAISVAIESKSNNSVQLDSSEIIKFEESNVLVNDKNKKYIMAPESESIAFEETENIVVSQNVELVTEKIYEDVEKNNEHIQYEDTTMAVDDSVQDSLIEQPTPKSDHIITTSDNNLIESTVPLHDSLIKPFYDQIKPIGQNSVVEGSQQQVVAFSESVLNNDVKKLEDKGFDLDQQSVLSMTDSKLKDLVMRDLSDDPSQNICPLHIEIKSSDFIKDEKQKKIEYLENILCAADKIVIGKEKTTENAVADALSILATAAPPSNETADSIALNPIQSVMQIKQKEPAWCDVGVIKGTNCLVKQFYSASVTDEHENISLNNLPNYINKLKIDIQPGTAYKFRVAAINACGRGEWNEISAFKTCIPGYPEAPSAINIIKVPDGVRLTWEAPPISSGKILEYSVCMAIKNPKEGQPQSPKPTTTNFNFVRVYSGLHNVTEVSHESLSAALIDRTSKPAIIFRIAAKNEKGYGPATQVRWLQDRNVPGSNENTSLKKAKSVNLLTGDSKIPKI